MSCVDANIEWWYIRSSAHAGTGAEQRTTGIDNQDTQIVTSPGELEAAVAKYAQASHYGPEIPTESETAAEDPKEVCLIYFFFW